MTISLSSNFEKFLLNLQLRSILFFQVMALNELKYCNPKML